MYSNLSKIIQLLTIEEIDGYQITIEENEITGINTIVISVNEVNEMLRIMDTLDEWTLDLNKMELKIVKKPKQLVKKI